MPRTTRPISYSNCKLVGLPHHDAPSLLDDLREGRIDIMSEFPSDQVPVIFLPEPHNPADPSAVSVQVAAAALSDNTSRKLGYIPREAAAMWQRFLTTKPSVSAIVSLAQGFRGVEKRSVWEVSVASRSPGLPSASPGSPTWLENFIFQDEVWGMRRPKRRRRHPLNVWI